MTTTTKQQPAAPGVADALATVRAAMREADVTVTRLEMGPFAQPVTFELRQRVETFLATAKRKGLGAIKIENAYVLRAMVIITDPRS